MVNHQWLSVINRTGCDNFLPVRRDDADEIGTTHHLAPNPVFQVFA